MVWMFGPVGRGQDVTIVVRVVLGWSDGTAWYSSQFLLISFVIVFSTDISLHRHGYKAIFAEVFFLCFLPPLLKAVHWTLDRMDSGEGFVCIEACIIVHGIIVHCIIVQCIHTLYGCIIVHSVYYVYTI